MDWSWIKEFAYEDICRVARERPPYTFARYGDGEWISLLQLKCHTKRNCDWHYFYPAMGLALKDVLKSRPNYKLGLQKLATEIYPNEIQGFLLANKLTDLDWVEADVLHRASKKGQLGAFAKECKGAVWIGPQHLAPVAEALQAKKFVVIPTENMWESYGEVHHRSINAVKKGDLVLVSCGMPGKILIHALQSIHPTATILDTGAIWDPFGGVKSRKYMQTGSFSIESLLNG